MDAGGIIAVMDGDAQGPANTASLGAAREARHGIRRAMGEIETALATAASGRAPASSELADRIQVLRKAFGHHVELTESPKGFLSEIVDHAPKAGPRRREAPSRTRRNLGGHRSRVGRRPLRG